MSIILFTSFHSYRFFIIIIVIVMSIKIITSIDEGGGVKRGRGEGEERGI